jgi:tricorn protease
MFPCYSGVALRGWPRKLKQILPVAALAVALLLPGQANADSPGAPAAPLWLRYPAISPDGKSIAFSFEGHIFVVPSAGGVAQPLTVGSAHDTAPVWSPDGKLIAFASDQYGHFSVFLASLEGGLLVVLRPTQLTRYQADSLRMESMSCSTSIACNR